MPESNPDRATCDTHGPHDPSTPCPHCTPAEAVMHQLKTVWMEGPWADETPWPVDGETFKKMAAVIAGELRPMAFIDIDPAKIDTEAIERFVASHDAHRIMVIDDLPQMTYGPPFQQALKNRDLKLAGYADLLEMAWTIIANGNGGDWDKATPDWKAAAEKWRDDYHALTRPTDGSERGGQADASDPGQEEPDAG